MPRFRLLAMGAAAVLSACAAPPKLTSADAPPGPIGLIYAVPDEFRHAHFGTTVFNNFLHTPAAPRGFSAKLRRTFQAGITAGSGREVRFLRPKKSDYFRLLDENWRTEEWGGQIKPAYRDIFDRLRESKGTGTFVVVSYRPSTPYYEWPEASGVGIYTRSLFSIDRGYAMSTFHTLLVNGSTYKVTALSGDSNSFTALKNFDWPDQIDESQPLYANEAMPLILEAARKEAAKVGQTLADTTSP